MDLSSDVGLSHVEFYVADVATAAANLVGQYGFRPVGWAGFESVVGKGYSLALRQGKIDLVLTKGLTDDHPASGYVQTHGDGVADIALTTPDVAAVFDTAVACGACPVAEPTRRGDGSITATIAAFGDVQHTFVQQDRILPAGLPPEFTAMPDLDDRTEPSLLHDLDHFAVCLEPGQLDPTVQFYEQVLGFRMVFAERIIVGAQAMNSKVVQSVSGRVTLTLIEPDTSAEPGQIDDFIRDHGGAGVQHLAFSTDDIVQSIGTLRNRGLKFLTTPDAYYELLGHRLQLAAHDVQELHELNVLVDEDHDGQLFQIFTRSAHPRRTLFFEIIERLGARTFGSANITALYEAVEVERTRSLGLSA
jgi:4-hydroxymandelate synthase